VQDRAGDQGGIRRVHAGKRVFEVDRAADGDARRDLQDRPLPGRAGKTARRQRVAAAVKSTNAISRPDSVIISTAASRKS